METLTFSVVGIILIWTVFILYLINKSDNAKKYFRNQYPQAKR